MHFNDTKTCGYSLCWIVDQFPSRRTSEAVPLVVIRYDNNSNLLYKTP